MHVSKEDYLRIIFELNNEQGARIVDIARELGIAKPSAHEMVNKLIAEELLRKDKFSKIFLTNKGKNHAKKLKHKHNVIRDFAVKILKHKESEAHSEAHKLEHAFSDKSINKLKQLLEKGQVEEDYEESNEGNSLPNYVG